MIELDLKKNPRYSIFSFLAKNSASNTIGIALMVLPEAGPSMTNIEMRNSTAGKSGRICWSTTVCTLYKNNFCTIYKNNFCTGRFSLKTFPIVRFVFNVALRSELKHLISRAHYPCMLFLLNQMSTLPYR